MFKNSHIEAEIVAKNNIPPPSVGKTGPGAGQWREFLIAVFALPAKAAYSGKIPASFNRNGFTGRMGTVAKRMGGKVGVACRGDQFWIWPLKKPSRLPHFKPANPEIKRIMEERKVTRQGAHQILKRQQRNG